MKFYKTLKSIETLGMVIPPNTIVILKFQSEHDTEYGYFKFLGLYSGLSKLITINEVEIIEEDYQP